ncbi:MAG TPA: ATP-binding protein [Polyangiaceae bacterium]|jgi:signal transduction histidine kinase|nr:ATP-binding protein [Polyangiaceae bacterium]
MHDQERAASQTHESRLTALEQLCHADRLATLGRLAASVAHELRNPLNLIELRAQLMTSDDVTTLSEAKHSAAMILEQVHRMTRIIDEVLSFARERSSNITRLDLREVLRRGIGFLEQAAKANEAKIVLDLPDDAVEIEGDADKLVQVIVNLATNGLQSMPPGGTLHVTMYEERAESVQEQSEDHVDHHVCIEVTDHGAGIPAHILPRLFEPFFSTKSANGGTGLGLSVAQRIVEDHSGWISVDSLVGQGTSFKVHLPLSAAGACAG